MISKKTRELVRAKFNGRCAFCGDKLNGCHIWDIDPISMFVDENGDLKRTGENVENLYPACKSCESTRRKHYQGKMTIEQFRKDIAQSFAFLRMGGLTSQSYGKAIRFGLITETNKPIVFFFEKVTQTEIEIITKP